MVRPPMHWQLDLCFKAELKLLPIAYEPPRKGPLDVHIYLVSEPPFGTVQLVEYDKQLVRLRQTEGGSAVAPKRVHRGTSHEDSYGPQIDALFNQPGLSNLSAQEQGVVESKFHDHLTFVVKAAEKKPTYYRCTSLGTLYQGIDVVLYLPPTQLLEIENRKTLTGKSLPLKPTLYSSVDEAMYMPLLLDLCDPANRNEITMDLFVALEAKGPEHMVTARAAWTGARDHANYLPWLKGSLKQVAWASEIREQVVQHLRETARSWGHTKVPPPYAKVTERSPYRGDVTKKSGRTSSLYFPSSPRARRDFTRSASHAKGIFRLSIQPFASSARFSSSSRSRMFTDEKEKP